MGCGASKLQNPDSIFAERAGVLCPGGTVDPQGGEKPRQIGGLCIGRGMSYDTSVELTR